MRMKLSKNSETLSSGLERSTGIKQGQPMNTLTKQFARLALAGSLALPTVASAYVELGYYGYKWGDAEPGTGATISWSLTGSIDCSIGRIPTCTPLSNFMPSGFLSEIQAGFNAWSSVANLTFVQVVDNGVAAGAADANADIRISGRPIDGPHNTLAYASFPHGPRRYPPDPYAYFPGVVVSCAGDVFFDSAESWKIGFGGSGHSIFEVFAHELGHSLGLDVMFQ